MMKNFCFLLLIYCKFATSTIKDWSNGKASHEPPDIVYFRQKCKKTGEYSIDVELKRIPNPFLANENLPVWIAHSQDIRKLERLPNIMRDIGPFSVYQDPNTCSAAVFFHNCLHFDGTIDNRYVIHHVPYDILQRKAVPKRSNMIPLYDRVHSETSDENPSETEGIHEKQEYLKKYDRNWENLVRSKLEYPDTVYIEILVMVDHDMLYKFDNDYIAMVSHVIVLFNSVDMIYSQVEKPRIKINIAGIIIANVRGSFSAITKKQCYKYYDDGMKYEELEAACVVEAVKSTLSDYRRIIPLEHYDIVVFLTDHDLHINWYDHNEKLTEIPVQGLADIPEYKRHKGYKLSPKDVRVAIVSSHYNAFQSFTTVTHEIAHLFNSLHDQGEFRDENGECTRNLMKSFDSSYCRKCLLFSDNTKNQFHNFFGLRDACIFRNEPKSLLNPLATRLFLTTDEQCQCYGYSTRKSRNFGCIVPLLRSRIKCQNRLICLSEGDNLIYSHDTAYIMDGTPCDEAKVCWNKKCQYIQN